MYVRNINFLKRWRSKLVIHSAQSSWKVWRTNTTETSIRDIILNPYVSCRDLKVCVYLSYEMAKRITSIYMSKNHGVDPVERWTIAGRYHFWFENCNRVACSSFESSSKWSISHRTYKMYVLNNGETGLLILFCSPFINYLKICRTKYKRKKFFYMK